MVLQQLRILQKFQNLRLLSFISLSHGLFYSFIPLALVLCEDSMRNFCKPYFCTKNEDDLSRQMIQDMLPDNFDMAINVIKF